MVEVLVRDRQTHRQTDRQTDRQTRLKIRALQVCNRAKNYINNCRSYILQQNSEEMGMGRQYYTCYIYTLLSTQQSAYQSFHSTETPALILHNSLVRAVDDCDVSQLVLWDLSAAFKTVDHQTCRVLSDCVGITWYQSYLSEQTRSFVHAGHRLFTVTCSAPKGSVFGPLGFVAYIEDLTVMSEKHSILSRVCRWHTTVRQQYTRQRRACLRPFDQVYLWTCQVVCLTQTATKRRQNTDDLVWVASTGRLKLEPVTFSPAASFVICRLISALGAYNETMRH